MNGPAPSCHMARLLGLTAALTSCTGASSSEPASTAAPGTVATGVTLTNLGLPVDEMLRGPDHFVVTVPEFDHGGQDLNGDGDALDVVMFLVDQLDGRVTPTGFASRPLAQGHAMTPAPRFAPGYVALPVFEEWQGGSDLNRDGDAQDAVLHVLDLTTGEVEVLEYGIYPYGDTGVSAHEDSLSLLVYEQAQGESDFNGDGDMYDFSLHVWDAQSSAVERISGTPTGLLLAGDTVAFTFGEDYFVGDLNGDGDVGDYVLHLMDASTGTIMNTELAVSSTVGEVGGTWLVTLTDDTVYHVYAAYDPATAEVRELDVPAWYPAQPFGDLVATLVREEARGLDLNGDGDTWDAVAFAMDPRTGETLHAPLAAENLVAIEGWLGFLVDENAQDNADLNGDGLIGAQVPHAFEPATGTLVNLGGNAFDMRAAGDYLYFMRDEAVAGVDWNGDGDTLDYVPFWWDRRSRVVRHAKLSCWSPLDVRHGTLLIGVPESGQSEDLNDDGDLDDVITFAIDLATGVAASTGRVTGPGHLLSPRTALLRIPEFVDAEDFNGDGDFQDDVLFFAELFR